MEEQKHADSEEQSRSETQKPSNMKLPGETPEAMADELLKKLPSLDNIGVLARSTGVTIVKYGTLGLLAVGGILGEGIRAAREHRKK